MRRTFTLGLVLLVVASLYFLFVFFQPNQDEQHLYLYNWSQYLPDGMVERFERETGIQVTQDFYSSNEEMLAKIETGKAEYDLVVPGDYMVRIMIAKGLLRTIDSDEIPNLRFIDERFSDPPYDPDLQHSVPFTFGTNGLGLDTSKYSGSANDWDILFSPPDELSGRIMMLNDARMSIGAALKYLGYSFNSTDKAQLLEAKNALLQQKTHIMAYDTDNYLQFLSSGETWLAYGYSGDIAQASQQNPKIRYVIPKSGSVFWVDSYCILKEAPHPKAAAAFINFILEPRNHAEITNDLRYGCPNSGARPYILPDLLNDQTIFPPEEILMKCEFIEDVGHAAKIYQDIWTAIKAE